MNDLVAVSVTENLLDFTALVTKDLRYLLMGIIRDPPRKLRPVRPADPDAGTPLELPLDLGNARGEKTPAMLMKDFRRPIIDNDSPPRPQRIGDPVLAPVEDLPRRQKQGAYIFSSQGLS